MFEIVEKEEKDVEVVIFISPRLVTAPAVAASDEASPTTPPPPWEIQPAAPMPPPAPPPPAEDHTASDLRPVGGVRSTSLPKLPPPRIVP
jgi:hypothetical protein